MNGGDGCGEGEGRLVTELEVVLRDKVKFNKEKEEKEEKEEEQLKTRTPHLGCGE